MSESSSGSSHEPPSAAPAPATGTGAPRRRADDDVPPTDDRMTFWTRFYVGGMAGLVGGVLGAIISPNTAWLACALFALFGVPMVWLSVRARNWGYAAGYYVVAAVIAMLFVSVAPYLHS